MNSFIKEMINIKLELLESIILLDMEDEIFLNYFILPMCVDVRQF